MGGNPSITDQQKQELWNRDINRLFTTAKIIPIQLLTACFIQSISTIGDKNESNLICLFCSDGTIRGILYSTKSTSISSSLIFSKVAESQNIFSSDENASKPIRFTSAIKISEKYIVVTMNDGRFFLVSVREKQSSGQNSDENKSIFFEFVLTSFSLPTNQTSSDDLTPCIVKYTNDSFIAIDSEMTAALCKSDGSTQIIWEGKQLQTNQSATQDKKENSNDSQKQHFKSYSLNCCAAVYENYLFAVHFSRDGNWKGLTYGIVKERINPLQSFDESFKTIIEMDTYESGIFCLCDTKNETDKDGRFSVISIDIDKNQIVKSPIIINFKELNPKDNFVIDFKVIDNKKLLLCLTENSIITYSPDIENHIAQCQINIPGIINFAQFASFSTQLVFNIAISCDQNQPNLYILRITRKSKKILLETFPMSVRLNEGLIVGSCPVDDFTFATLEDNGKIVLWQSQPEWWDVPYFQKIFDDQQQQ